MSRPFPATDPAPIATSNSLSRGYAPGVFLRRLILRAGLFLVASPLLAGVNQWTPLGPYGTSEAIPVRAIAVSNAAIFAAAEQGLFRSDDGGGHWDLVLAAGPDDVWVIAVAPSDSSIVYAGGWGTFFRSGDGGTTWTAAPLAGHVVQALAVDFQSPTTVWAGTADSGTGNGSVLKTLNGGSDWQSVLTPLFGSVTSIAVDPVDGQTAFAGTRAGELRRTRDGGAHWTALEGGGDLSFAIAIDPAEPSHVYTTWDPTLCPGVCTVPGALRKSEDGGDTWSQLDVPGQYVWAVAIAPGSVVYVSTSSGAHVSTDGGSTWSALDATSEFVSQPLVLDPANPSRLFSAGFEGVFVLQVEPGGPCAFPGRILCLQSGRFRVTVGWQASPLGPTFPAAAVPVTSKSGYFWFFHADNVEVMVKVLDGTFVNGHFWVFYGSLSSVQYTVHVTDTVTGETKTYENQAGVLASVADTSAFPATAAGSSAVPATGRKATPVGRSDAPFWTALGPEPDRGVYAIAVDPRYPHIYAAAGGQDYTVFKSNDGGATWVPLVTLPEFVGGLHLDLYSPDIVYAVTASSLYRSADAGGTWQAIANGLGVCCLAFDSLAAGTLYAGSPTGFLVSTDHGSTWTPRGPELAGKPVGPIATTSSGKFYAVAERKNLWTSNDSGLSWSLVHEFPNAVLQALTVDRSQAFTVYVSESCCGGVGPTVPIPVPVWKSEDGGSTWTEILRIHNGANAIALDPSDPSVLYAGGNDGVFRSANAGRSWTQLNEGLSGQVFTLALPPGSTLFAGTSSGAFKLDLGGFPGSCQPDGVTLCLNDGRFKVEAAFQLSPSGPVIEARAVRLTGDTGYFWFFEDANVEVVVKVLDGRFVNGHFWVFYGALSSVEYTITVTDTQTGEVRAYHNERGHLASVADTTAF